MDIRFDGKTIVIIGGSTGIGKATVKLFAQSGGRVIFTGLEKKIDMDINSYHEKSDPVPVYRQLNVRDEKDVEKFAEEVHNEYGGCDVLHNNAGILTVNILHEVTTEEWQKAIDVNLTGMFYASKYFIPQMMKKGKGAIVNTSSISGLFGDYNFCAYNTSKGAVVNLTRNMALDYAKYNIRVNAVAPGTVKTPMYYAFAQDVGGIDTLDFGSAAVYPGLRVGMPEEIANAVVFLASDKASFISGINLVIDGGITAHTGQQRDFEAARRMMNVNKQEQ